MGEITPEPGTSPPMPQNTVVFNGAAANFLTQLVESVRTDMRAMQVDLTRQIDDRFDTHEEVHGVERVDDLDFQRRTRERLSDLEQKDIEDAKAEAVRVARRQGQLSLFTGMGQVATAVERNGRWIVTAIVFLAALLATTLGNIRISFGP